MISMKQASNSLDIWNRPFSKNIASMVFTTYIIGLLFPFFSLHHHTCDHFTSWFMIWEKCFKRDSRTEIEREMFDQVNKMIGMNQARDHVSRHRVLLHRIDEKLNKFLHAALNTSAMVAERTAEDSVKLVHSLLGRWLCP